MQKRREWNVSVYMNTFNSVQSQNHQWAIEVYIPWFSRKNPHILLIPSSGTDTFDKSITWFTAEVILFIYLFIYLLTYLSQVTWQTYHWGWQIPSINLQCQDLNSTTKWTDFKKTTSWHPPLHEREKLKRSDFVFHGTDKQNLTIIPIQNKMLHSYFTVRSSWLLLFIYWIYLKTN